jgi:LPPG:FO 2-phospho-L-lactate transferase
MITALSGGVGGSKLVLGLYRVLPPDTLTVIVNTADDLTMWGLEVSPDLDTTMYTLSGLAQPDLGWGINSDTFNALDALGRYGMPTWFRVGDRDLATHIFRTAALRQGKPLSAVTAEIARALDVRAEILPATDNAVSTRLRTVAQWLDFQEYFVHRRHDDPIDAVSYQGVTDARPAPGVIASIERAQAVILANSNPVLSIIPILEVPGVRETLQAKHSVVAVSPIVGNDAVTGPAGRLMSVIGKAPTVVGLADAYRDVIDGLVIDEQDSNRANEVEALGIQVLCTRTIMQSLADRERLAQETLEFAESLA